MFDWLARLMSRDCGDGERNLAAKPSTIAGDSQGVDAEAAFARGSALFDEKRWDEAARAFSAAVEARHDWAEAHHKLGLCMFRLGRLEEASDAYAMALCFSDRPARVHFDLACVERRQGKAKAALESAQRAIDEGQNTAEAHNLKGALLLEAEDVDGAMAAFEQAVALAPDDPSGHSNLGYLLFRDRAEYADGAAHIQRAVELDPSNIGYRCNLTMVLAHQGEFERALALCDQILAARPEMHEARLNRGLLLLKFGRFETGWPDYEARKRVRSNYVSRDLPWPEWQGEPLQGKTLLIHGEQGLGDEVMFASCIPEIMDKAGGCVIECAPRLEALFRRSFPAATVVAGKQTSARPAWIDRAPTIDLQISSGSLPLRLGRDWNSFPQHRGYLQPHPASADRWRQRLDELGPGLKVGLSWRGGLPSTRRSLRSIELSSLVPLWGIPNTHFIDLQYGDTAEERRRLSAEHDVVLHSWTGTVDDLDETAALVSQLDLVISVCTAVIHFAGALGRDVWVLVPTVPEWRYQAQGEGIPWYPSARLIRQSVAGDWSSVIDEAASRLEQRVRVSE